MKKFLLIVMTAILFLSNGIASASSPSVASTENRHFWELWNRYNNSYYEDPVRPDQGIKFNFELANSASAQTLGNDYPNKAYVSDDDSTIFKGGYLITSIDAFDLPEGSTLEDKALSVKLRLKIDGTNPVFLYPADELSDKNSCSAPARVSLYFESLTADNGYWYLDTSSSNGFKSLDMILAEKGPVTLQASFELANWKDANGQAAASISKEFSQALSSVSNVGVTIGGGCFAAAGVALQKGTAKSGQFEVIEIALTD